MQKDKNPELKWSPRHKRTAKKTWQLGMAIWGPSDEERTGWVAIPPATVAARMNGGYILLGYFDPTSDTVKRNQK